MNSLTECNQKNNRYLSLAISLFGLLLLLANTLGESKPACFDEIFYIKEVTLINKLGVSLDFLRSSQVAVGPLTAIIHYLLQPITHLQVPSIRLVNFFLLVLIFLVLIGSLNILGYVKPIFHVLTMVAAPILWPISGMALTEIPAMFFSSLGLYFFLIVFCSKPDTKLDILNQKYPLKSFLSLLGGLLFGFSILGRQTFLVGLFAFPLLLLKEAYTRKYIYLFLSTSLLLPIFVFSIWGGIVPPLHLSRQGYISTETFSIVNGFSSFAYTGIVMAIIAPKCFILQRKMLLGAIFISTILLTINLFYNFLEISPAISVVSRIFSSSPLNIYVKVCSGILIVFGVFFVFIIYQMIIENKNDLVYVFLCIYFFLLSITPFKIVHLFSSRYTATTLPILILLTARYSTNDRWKPLRLFLGVVAGFLILRSFFNAN
jgi:hypothetical protein